MSLRTLLLLAFMLPGGALAAEPLPATPPPPGAQGASGVDGTVRNFTLAADGRVNGMLLDDGTEVHTPRALAAVLEQAVQQGDEVHVQGWRTPTPGVMTATSVTDARTGKALVGPAAPPAPLAARHDEPPRPLGLPPPGARETTLTGRVLRPLHGADGQTDGALLGDGMELRLPAGAARSVTGLLAPGARLAAQGYALQTPFGQVLAVQAIGSNSGALVPVAPGPKQPPAD